MQLRNLSHRRLDFRQPRAALATLCQVCAYPAGTAGREFAIRKKKQLTTSWVETSVEHGLITVNTTEALYGSRERRRYGAQRYSQGAGNLPVAKPLRAQAKAALVPFRKSLNNGK